MYLWNLPKWSKGKELLGDNSCSYNLRIGRLRSYFNAYHTSSLFKNVGNDYKSIILGFIWYKGYETMVNKVG